MIEELLAKKQESDLFDIKQEYYEKDEKFALIKDVVSFANCREFGDKYIIFGVENKTFDIWGTCSELPDISDIQSLLNTYVEPSIDIEIGNQIIRGQEVKYIKIKNCVNKPYMIKKTYCKNGKTELKEGEIYIRKNATNSIATRNDLIQMFSEKEKVSILSSQLFILPNAISLLLEIRNETSNILNISKILLRIISNKQEFVVNRCYVYDNNKKIKNKLCIDKDNCLQINKNSRLVEWLYFDIDDRLLQLITNNKELNIYLKIIDNKFLDTDVKVEI